MTAGKVTLVLGMHRGGTSAVAGLLAGCGLQPPRTLAPADERNVAGYWESTILQGFHDTLLRTAGTRWDSYNSIDGDWLESAATAQLRTQASELLRHEFDFSRPFVLKDPRICRFLPFWFKVFEAEGIAPTAVLVVRHPSEVAASLAARNGLRRRFSLLIWLRHMLDAEASTRSIRRTVLHYDDVLHDGRAAVRRLSADLGTLRSDGSMVDAESIEGFLRKDLKHHHHRGDEESESPQMLASWLERTWTALAGLSAPEHETTLLRTLDEVRHEFDRVTGLLGVEAEAQLVETLDRVAMLESEVSARTARMSILEAHNSGLRALATNLEGECAAFRSSLSWRVTAPLRALARLVR